MSKNSNVNVIHCGLNIHVTIIRWSCLPATHFKILLLCCILWIVAILSYKNRHCQLLWYIYGLLFEIWIVCLFYDRRQYNGHIVVFNNGWVNFPLTYNISYYFKHAAIKAFWSAPCVLYSAAFSMILITPNVLANTKYSSPIKSGYGDTLWLAAFVIQYGVEEWVYMYYLTNHCVNRIETHQRFPNFLRNVSGDISKICFVCHLVFYILPTEYSKRHQCQNYWPKV